MNLRNLAISYKDRTYTRINTISINITIYLSIGLQSINDHTTYNFSISLIFYISFKNAFLKKTNIIFLLYFYVYTTLNNQRSTNFRKHVYNAEK